MSLRAPSPPPGGGGDSLARAWAVREANFGPLLTLIRLGRTRAVSLTGPDCALNCAHCGGRYLLPMGDLERVGQEAEAGRISSVLVSGGCAADGSLHFSPHRTQLARLARQVRLNFHVGLFPVERWPELEGLADTVSFDLVTDDQTIREVYGLAVSGDAYWRAYRALSQRVRTVPHVCLGLKGGAIDGEWGTLERLAAEPPEVLVFIVFIPTPGTAYADRPRPDLAEVAAFLAEARLRLPGTRLLLGCLRPGGRYRQELDQLAVRAGINAIVQPAAGLEEFAAGLGLAIAWGEECCAL